MMIRTSFAAAGLVLAFGIGAALAQTTPPAAPATPAAPAAPAATVPPAPAGSMKKGEKPRTAKSLACSADADKQGLHGKPRKAFMGKCKAGKA